jgi:N utilization substance protein B
MARRRGAPVNDPRTDARERTLLMLYEAETKGIEPRAVLEAQVIRPDEHTVALVIGVGERRAELDDVIAAHSHGWTLARMPAIDRNVLRLGAYELADRPDVPVAVVIDEAVELAKRFSTDDSGRFVNGVLSALAPLLRST